MSAKIADTGGGGGGGSSDYPALPSGSTLIIDEDFESGTVGASYTSNQCDATNNQVINDPGGTEGKIWEAWWDVGDPPVAAHQARCEMGGLGEHAEETEWVYRYKLKVPSDSLLVSSYHYRLQFHGTGFQPPPADSTSPPIALWVVPAATAGSGFFDYTFGAGDSSWWQLDDNFPAAKDVWHAVQIRVRWSRATTGWVEFHWNNAQVPVAVAGRVGGNIYRWNGKTLHASQGDPDHVAPKFGLDGEGFAQSSGRVHGYVAHFRAYQVV